MLQLLRRLDRYCGLAQLLEHIKVLTKIALEGKNSNGELIDW
ncbi:hypothetical protein GCM10009655_16710 [Rhodoglobus aureus]|uniref:Uncharacterized protein n=1 Tax=Rhodoglobus aureus TaxID=191497 RepID=A0ABN1VQ97_9MICO